MGRGPGSQERPERSSAESQGEGLELTAGEKRGGNGGPESSDLREASAGGGGASWQGGHEGVLRERTLRGTGGAARERFPFQWDSPPFVPFPSPRGLRGGSADLRGYYLDRVRVRLHCLNAEARSIEKTSLVCVP